MYKDWNEFKAAWTTALRSGAYEQDEGRLCTEKGFCCLGVAFDLLVKAQPEKYVWRAAEGNRFRYAQDATDSTHYDSAILTSVGHSSLPEWLIGPLTVPIAATEYRKPERTLIDRNDAGWTFAQIADYIDKAM
jgi:hypothetical protein